MTMVQAFSPPINISNFAESDTLPEIAAVGDNVYITWTNTVMSNKENYVAISDDNGQTFTVLLL